MSAFLYLLLSKVLEKKSSSMFNCFSLTSRAGSQSSTSWTRAAFGGAAAAAASAFGASGAAAASAFGGSSPLAAASLSAVFLTAASATCSFFSADGASVLIVEAVLDDPAVAGEFGL